MNGAQVLVRTLLAGGIDTVFSNPGTSEMHFVAALDESQGMRCVLCLFEGVATGAADGFARMAGRPAATLLHLGPGLANGLANLHNAKKAKTPLVNIVGDHAQYHRHENAPLTSDVEAIAAPFSGWVRTSASAGSVGDDGAAAIAASFLKGGQVATLILPANTAWEQATAIVPDHGSRWRAPLVADLAVRQTAEILRKGAGNILLIGGNGLTERGLSAAGRISRATGTRLLCPTSNARIQRGAGRVACPPIPYPLKDAIETLRGTQNLILAGAHRPVAYFAYPGKPAYPTPDDCKILSLATVEEDVVDALERLADELNAVASGEHVARAAPMLVLDGPIDPASFAAVIADLLPDNAIVVDEALTCGHRLLDATIAAPPHDWLQLTGGAIGIGLPLATGAAIACPDRKVLCLQADGSGMYTLQALWTHAREGLDITTVILANRKYATLHRELENVGVSNPGPNALGMLDLSHPDLDWPSIAKGMGVEGSRANSTAELKAQLSDAMQRRGPRLIEAVF